MVPDPDNLSTATSMIESSAEQGTPPAEIDRTAAIRALRSLEATEARLMRNAKRETDEAKGELVMELLPVLDNLDRTIEAARQHRSEAVLLEGVRMLRAQLEAVLLRYGVEKIDATNQQFDPKLHEAVGVTPVADLRAHGAVTHQAQPGYRYAGRLLRPAKVIVGKSTRPHPFYR
jgi:molecular chaperone GrpE (heat shock protein)